MKKYSLEELSKMNSLERIDFAKEVNSLPDSQRQEFYLNYSFKERLILAKYLLDAVKEDLNEKEMKYYDGIEDLRSREFFDSCGEDYDAKMN